MHRQQLQMNFQHKVLHCSEELGYHKFLFSLVFDQSKYGCIVNSSILTILLVQELHCKIIKSSGKQLSICFVMDNLLIMLRTHTHTHKVKMTKPTAVVQTQLLSPSTSALG